MSVDPTTPLCRNWDRDHTACGACDMCAIAGLFGAWQNQTGLFADRLLAEDTMTVIRHWLHLLRQEEQQQVMEETHT